MNVDYAKEPKQVVRDAALFLFDLHDCSYDTFHELMENVSSLNSRLFLEKVELGNENRVHNFLRLRGDTVRVTTEEVLKAAAGNSEGGGEVMRLLLDR
jgi:hypothetical protein